LAKEQKRSAQTDKKSAQTNKKKDLEAKAKRKSAAKTVAKAANEAEKVTCGDTALDDQIRERAYVIWIEEGQPHGRDLEHWLRARDELLRSAA